MERFKPQMGEKYWVITAAHSTWGGDCVDNIRYATGNCHATKQEAEAHRDMLMRIASGRAVVVDVPEGWEVDTVKCSDFKLSDVPKIIMHFKPTPPPPPKEITVKVYDRNIHGEPNHPRSQWVSETEYIYTDELEGL